MNTKGLMFPKPKDKDSKKEKKIYKMKIRSSKRAKACDIPIAVKKKVLVRDKGFCVVGIEQNVVCMCINCHNAYDNGKDKKKVRKEEIYKNKIIQDLVAVPRLPEDRSRPYGPVLRLHSW